jgi:hypothetical protein
VRVPLIMIAVLLALWGASYLLSLGYVDDGSDSVFAKLGVLGTVAVPHLIVAATVTLATAELIYRLSRR